MLYGGEMVLTFLRISLPWFFKVGSLDNVTIMESNRSLVTNAFESKIWDQDTQVAIQDMTSIVTVSSEARERRSGECLPPRTLS
jgi:hypothetical protein